MSVEAGSGGSEGLGNSRPRGNVDHAPGAASSYRPGDRVTVDAVVVYDDHEYVSDTVHVEVETDVRFDVGRDQLRPDGSGGTASTANPSPGASSLRAEESCGIDWHRVALGRLILALEIERADLSGGRRRDIYGELLSLQLTPADIRELWPGVFDALPTEES